MLNVASPFPRAGRLTVALINPLTGVVEKLKTPGSAEDHVAVTPLERVIGT